MKKAIYLLALAIITISTTSCGIKIKTRGEIINKQIVINQPFNSICNYSEFDVEFTEGPLSIKLVAPKECVDLLEIKVEDDNTLCIYRKDMQQEYIINQNNIEGKLIISSQGVNSFITLGTGDFDFKNLNVEDLRLVTSGTGDFEGNVINCDKVYIETTGTGDAEFNIVKANEATIKTTGTGDIEIDDIICKNLDISTSGTGDISLAGECKTLRKEESGTGTLNITHLLIKE